MGSPLRYPNIYNNKNAKKNAKKTAVLNKTLDVHGIALAGVLLLALLIRVWALCAWSDSVYADVLLTDEQFYHQWALAIVENRDQRETVYEFSPLPAYLMAAIYTLFDSDPLLIRIANIGLGVGTVLLLYSIGRALFNRDCGLVAALIAAGFAPFILYNITLLKTSLSLFLIALAVSLLLSLHKRMTMSLGLSLGLCLAAMINVRGNYLVLVPLILLALAWAHYRSSGKWHAVLKVQCTLLLGLVLGLAPFTLRNLVVADEWALSTSQSGFNFYIGNHLANPGPYFQPLPFAETSARKQGVQFTIEASRRNGQRLSATEASSFWWRQSLEEMAAAPLQFLSRLALKSLLTVNHYEANDHYHIGFIRKHIDFFQYPWLPAGPVLVLGLMGLLLYGANSLATRQLLLLAIAYAASIALFFVFARYRAPLFIFFIPFAAFVLLSCAKNLVALRSRISPRAAAALIVSTALVFYPLPGIDDQSTYLNLHAFVLHQKGQEQRAMQYWRYSSLSAGRSADFGTLGIAQAWLRRGDTQKALAYLQNIDDNSYAVANKYALLGTAMELDNLPRAAARFYRQSLQYNEGQLPVRERLIALLQHRAPTQAAFEVEKLQDIRRYYE